MCRRPLLFNICPSRAVQGNDVSTATIMQFSVLMSHQIAMVQITHHMTCHDDMTWWWCEGGVAAKTDASEETATPVRDLDQKKRLVFLGWTRDHF